MQDIMLHPTYFGTLTQLALCAQYPEAIVWEIHDNYQKQTFRNRCYIATNQGSLLLSIPIQHAKGARQRTKEVRSEPSEKWNELHWKSIVTAYRSSPFFEFYEDDLHPFFERGDVSLLEHSRKSISFMLKALQLSGELRTTSSYEVTPNEKVVDLRGLVNAKTKNKIVLTPYPQVFDSVCGFIGGISPLDLLFNVGPKEARSYLEQIDLSALF
jgi:hypothetical protein